MASTITVAQVIKQTRVYPELFPVIGRAGWSDEPAITISNDVMQRILSEPFNWKFNRAAVTPFLTVALQQDYITSITDLTWLEYCLRVDINNTTTPKPIFASETVKELDQTSYQGLPFNVAWVPNSLAIFGTWTANTSYPTGLGAASTPTSPIQQFIDANGNYLRVTTNGTSGNVQPAAAAGASVGTTVTDGTVTWTVTDPNGVAIRLSPLPATSGIVWQMKAFYQKTPPLITTLSQTIAPIPDSFGYLFRQGFIAKCYEHAGRKEARESYALWEEALYNAARSADRERESFGMYPSEGISGGRTWGTVYPVGPAFPYWPGF